MTIACHKLIAKTAQDMAHELYGELMRDQVLYKAWKAQNVGAGAKALERRFVDRVWPDCIEQARATLALMLRGPYDEDLKESIYEALQLDKTLAPNGVRVGAGAKIVGAMNDG